MTYCQAIRCDIAYWLIINKKAKIDMMIPAPTINIMKPKLHQRPHVFFSSKSAFLHWMATHYQQADGIWAVYPIQSKQPTEMNWDALVEGCLMYGWIDSVSGKVDSNHTKAYISPRKPTSGWSKRNKVILQRLIDEKKMDANGLMVVERAKQNGSWTRYDDAEAGILHPDLLPIFQTQPALQNAWDRFSPNQKRNHLQFLYDAKTPATLQKRIESLCQTLRNKIR